MRKDMPSGMFKEMIFEKVDTWEKAKSYSSILPFTIYVIALADLYLGNYFTAASLMFPAFMCFKLGKYFHKGDL